MIQIRGNGNSNRFPDFNLPEWWFNPPSFPRNQELPKPKPAFYVVIYDDSGEEVSRKPVTLPEKMEVKNTND
ncbi:MAG: hypothetical protein ACI8Z7_000200 [Candidatus Nanohaloarchaea archaeon]